MAIDMLAMAEALDGLNQRVGAWQKQVNARFAERWTPVDGFGEKMQEAAKAATREVGDSPIADLNAFLDDVADTYVAVGPELRAEIRRLVGDCHAVLMKMYEYIGHAANQLHETGSVTWLRRGLAGAAIEDARIDFRDLYFALGDIYLEARRAGLDPMPTFKEIGRLANPEPTGRSVASMLEHFNDSAFFIADVKPKIGLDSWTW